MNTRYTRRYGHPLTLLLLDIDNFKVFNDTFGHQEGDRILCHVATLLAGNCRTTDTVARYGGEEFAIILPNTPKKAAAELAERVRWAIRPIHQDRAPGDDLGRARDARCLDWKPVGVH